MKKFILGIMVLALMLSILSCVEVSEETSDNSEKNYLFTLKIHIEDVMNGTGDTKIGEYAYIEAEKTKFEELDDKYFIEFSEDFVEGSGYNWVLIKFDDGTGITYTASEIDILTYGKINSDGMVSDVMGYYLIKNDGVTYQKK